MQYVNHNRNVAYYNDFKIIHWNDLYGLKYDKRNVQNLYNLAFICI